MSTVHRLGAVPSSPDPSGLVWYASYGSNTDPDRLRYYIVGGQPSGAARTYPGCRDSSPPRRSVAIEVPGLLYFATESPVWTGGRAFYDPDADGVLWARAHLVTAEQFADIAAQEMYEAPGRDLDLNSVLAEGRVALGPGRYETLVCPGSLGGIPVVTFTAPWRCRDVAVTRPSSAYLRHLALGLLSSHAWEETAVAHYLAQAPGVAGEWTPSEMETLIAAD
ncbi:histone deacetylase [Streptomyces albipurpureus]|uniref:Histone deacetylase n=1 Tax=Streptomyces albipurpureus TaxID=2897419 RepID=A0ABT0URZ1_9ACTN|nr:histone deacetylase [Streptomyces sp. CWNU-1]MCM2391384.1 histone deacetylase [Streptomyces sp. CWNU-1]